MYYFCQSTKYVGIKQLLIRISKGMSLLTRVIIVESYSLSIYV